ncbi:MAG: YdcF family protein [Bryobacteraceae bacterium]
MKWRRGWVAVIASLLAIAAGALLLRGLGAWLIVEDPLQPARAAVVLPGQLPFRAMEAAAIYRQGWVGEVWLTQGGFHAEEAALERLGVEHPTEDFYSRQVLRKLGVPDQAIRTLSGYTQNTADDIRASARQLRAAGNGRVILITSKFHARRVRVVWQALAGGLPAIVRYASDDPFDAGRWWLNTGDAMAVSREYFGLMNAWAGFPVRSERW